MTTPRGLGAAGRAMWSEVSEFCDLDPMQVEILGAACRQRDRAQLFAVAAAVGDVTAARQERDSALAMARLLAALRLPDAAGRRPQARQVRGVYGPSRMSARDRLRAGAPA